jgi:hypothetical protein
MLEGRCGDESIDVVLEMGDGAGGGWWWCDGRLRTSATPGDEKQREEDRRTISKARRAP